MLGLSEKVLITKTTIFTLKNYDKIKCTFLIPGLSRIAGYEKNTLSTNKTPKALCHFKHRHVLFSTLQNISPIKS